MTESCHFDDEKSLGGAAFVFGRPVCINTGIACRFLVPRIYAGKAVTCGLSAGAAHCPSEAAPG